jgi:hypothetical protein
VSLRVCSGSNFSVDPRKWSRIYIDICEKIRNFLVWSLGGSVLPQTLIKVVLASGNAWLGWMQVESECGATWLHIYFRQSRFHIGGNLKISDSTEQDNYLAIPVSALLRRSFLPCVCRTNRTYQYLVATTSNQCTSATNLTWSSRFHLYPSQSCIPRS